MLKESVLHVKGIGEKFAEDLAEMDIYTIEDLLHHLPYKYDVMEIRPLSELVHEDKVTIVGRILYEPSLTFYGRKKSRLVFTVEVENVAVKAVMFNRAFAKKQLNPGDIVTLTGKWDAHRLQITVDNYRKGKLESSKKINPMYSVKGNVSVNRLRKVIAQAFKDYGHEITEILPES